MPKEAREEVEAYLQKTFKYGERAGFSRAGARNPERWNFKRDYYYQTRNGKRVRVKKSPYTKPKLRDKLKNQIQKGNKGGKPGQWSARKSQLLAVEYKKAGGGYRGKKTDSARSLDQWTKQKWRTKDGKPAIRDGYTTRYLPDKTWKKLSKNQAIATNRKKIAGSRKGKQFVSNTARAKA